MNEFTKNKAALLNAVWSGVYAVGDHFDGLLLAIEGCRTAEELARVEMWVRRADRVQAKMLAERLATHSEAS